MSDASAVVLVSGGLDSATCLAIARDEGLASHALSFRYGQRHHHELAAAGAVVAALGAHDHRVVELDLGSLGGSSLLGEGAVPVDRSLDEIGHGIPSTYVPARNTVFLAHALAWAEVLGAGQIIIGVNAVDHSGYPDCRPAFIQAFEAVANAGTRAGVEGAGYRVRAPLMTMTKAEIIRLGTSLGVDYGTTVSCYDPDDAGACGRCDACRLRRNGFVEAGVPDPTRYR